MIRHSTWNVNETFNWTLHVSLDHQSSRKRNLIFIWRKFQIFFTFYRATNNFESPIDSDSRLLVGWKVQKWNEFRLLKLQAASKSIRMSTFLPWMARTISSRFISNAIFIIMLQEAIWNRNFLFPRFHFSFYSLLRYFDTSVTFFANIVRKLNSFYIFQMIFESSRNEMIVELNLTLASDTYEKCSPFISESFHEIESNAKCQSCFSQITFFIMNFSAADWNGKCDIFAYVKLFRIWFFSD